MHAREALVGTGGPRMASGMILTVGALCVDASARADYRAGSRAVVEQARETDGCLDSALSADLVDERRFNVFERWADERSLARFHGDGPSGEQVEAIRSADVQEFRLGV